MRSSEGATFAFTKCNVRVATRVRRLLNSECPVTFGRRKGRNKKKKEKKKKTGGDGDLVISLSFFFPALTRHANGRDTGRADCNVLGDRV
jgi:hypothetical protein